MIKITKTELSEKITYYVQVLGLKNDEIAVRLNEEYSADEKEALTGLNVASLKKQLGIKGIKPKKKSLFEFVEDPIDSDSEGDIYMKNPGNIAAMKEGIKQVQEGNVIRLDPNKSVFDQIGEEESNDEIPVNTL